MDSKASEGLDGYQNIAIKNAVAANMKSLVYVCIFDLALCIIFPFVQTLVPLFFLSIIPVCLNIAYLMLTNN